MIVFAGLLSVAAGAFLTMWSGFDPSQVAVTGNRRVPSSEILRVADIPRNRSIWLDDTREIAARLNLSKRTVAAHRASIMSTLRIHKVAKLVAYALCNGLAS